MLVFNEYEFIRTPENKLLLIVTCPFERGDDSESFLGRLYEKGLWIRKKDGERVHLEVVQAELGLTLLVELDQNLNEEELL